MKLSKSKAKALSNISADIAQVFFGAVIAVIVLPLDSGKVLVVTLELGSAIIFWLFSVMFAEKGRL